MQPVSDAAASKACWNLRRTPSWVLPKLATAARLAADKGVTLADIYSAGGEVLMGTLRWEKESAERVAKDVDEVARTLKMVRLDAEEAELGVRVKSLQVELDAKKVERALLVRTTKTREAELSGGRSRMRELRGADAAKPVAAPR